MCVAGASDDQGLGRSMTAVEMDGGGGGEAPSDVSAVTDASLDVDVSLTPYMADGESGGESFLRCVDQPLCERRVKTRGSYGTSNVLKFYSRT